MTCPDEDHIRALTRELDEAVPREGIVSVTEDPDDESATRVRANQLGFLRLGVELLKAAYASKYDGEYEDRVQVDLEYLEGVNLAHYAFERSEAMRPPTSAAPTLNRLLDAILRWVFYLLLVGTTVIGAFIWIDWGLDKLLH